jgi:cytochrome b
MLPINSICKGYDHMTSSSKATQRDDLDVFTRTIHLGLMTCGILAWLLSGWAGEYVSAKHLGFTIHSWLGMGLASFIALLLIYGLLGPTTVRFTQWAPYTKERLLLVWEDIMTLLRFRLPDRPNHMGLAGLVQTFGLLTFTWMALTGSLMFFNLVPGQQAGSFLQFIMEIHEIGEGLIPVFLALHVGAVLLHALGGHHVWRKIFFSMKNDRGMFLGF